MDYQLDMSAPQLGGQGNENGGGGARKRKATRRDPEKRRLQNQLAQKKYRMWQPIYMTSPVGLFSCMQI